MPEPIDAMQPWTIKAVANTTREAVIKAARQEGSTVGQWLERRVREWVQDGAPVQISQPALETLSDLVQLAVAVSSVPAERADDPVLRTARVRIRRALLAQGGHTRSATQANQAQAITGPDGQTEITTPSALIEAPAMALHRPPRRPA